LNDSTFTKGLSAAALTKEGLGVFGPAIDKAIIVLLVVITFCCLVHLWKSQIEVKGKLKWSFVILLPLFGPLIYGYSNPKSQSKTKKYIKCHV